MLFTCCSGGLWVFRLHAGVGSVICLLQEVCLNSPDQPTSLFVKATIFSLPELPMHTHMQIGSMHALHACMLLLCVAWRHWMQKLQLQRLPSQLGMEKSKFKPYVDPVNPNVLCKQLGYAAPAFWPGILRLDLSASFCVYIISEESVEGEGNKSSEESVEGAGN